MVFCISVFAVCLLLLFICLVSVVADPGSRSFKEWVRSVLADAVGSILFRYLGCAFVVAGMTFSVGAYAAEEGPGQDPAPGIEESAAPTPTPVPSLGDDHAPEDPVVTMPPDYEPGPAVTSEPFMTAVPQELPPEPEITPEITLGNENGSPEGEISPDNSTPSNTAAPTSRPVAPSGGGGISFEGPVIFDDAVPTVEPTPMLASEYEQRLLYDVEYIEGLLCFVVVVVLCYFSYKFFRIFF